jgi:hypothetical protein
MVFWGKGRWFFSHRENEVNKKGVMLSLSKHVGKGLYARVFDRLRLTGPPTSKMQNVMGSRSEEAIPDFTGGLLSWGLFRFLSITTFKTSVILNVVMDLFYTMPILPESSRIDASYLPMTSFKPPVILRNEGSILHHARSLCMFTNRFFVPQNDRVERAVFTSFPLQSPRILQLSMTG